jgi:hypothetical protein
VDLATEGVEPVGHRLQVGTRPPAAGARAAALAGHFEPQLPIPRAQAHAGAGGAEVPGGAAQRFQRAEVHRCLDLLRVPPDPVRLDRNGDRGLARLGVQGGSDAHVGQQRRVDAAGQLAEAGQRRRDL